MPLVQSARLIFSTSDLFGLCLCFRVPERRTLYRRFLGVLLLQRGSHDYRNGECKQRCLCVINESCSRLLGRFLCHLRLLDRKLPLLPISMTHYESNVSQQCLSSSLALWQTLFTHLLPTYGRRINEHTRQSTSQRISHRDTAWSLDANAHFLNSFKYSHWFFSCDSD